MNHQRPAISRPQFEPVSSALHHPGLWQVFTDGEESSCKLLASWDAGLDALEGEIQSGIRQGWPLLLVIPQITAI